MNGTPEEKAVDQLRKGWDTALAFAHLHGIEEPMLRLYARPNHEDAITVVHYACKKLGVRQAAAQHAVLRVLCPTLQARGLLADTRPPGRRAVVDHEIQIAEQLFRRALHDAAIAVRAVSQ